MQNTQSGLSPRESEMKKKPEFEGDFVPFVEELAQDWPGLHVHSDIADYSWRWAYQGAILVDWEDLHGTFVVIEDPKALCCPSESEFRPCGDSLHLLIEEDGTVFELSEHNGSVEPHIRLSGAKAFEQWLESVMTPAEPPAADEAVRGSLHDLFPHIYVPFLSSPEELRSTPVDGDNSHRRGAVVPRFAEIEALVDLIKMHHAAGTEWLSPVVVQADHDTIAENAEFAADLAGTTAPRAFDALLSLHGWSPSIADATIACARQLDPADILDQRQDREYLLLTPFGLTCVSAPFSIPNTGVCGDTAVLEISEGHCAEYLMWWLRSREGHGALKALQQFIRTGDSAAFESARAVVPSRHEQIRTWVALQSRAEFLETSLEYLAHKARNPFQTFVGRDGVPALADRVKNQREQASILARELMPRVQGA